MNSTIKKIFGYSAVVLGSAMVAGVTTYALMEKHFDTVAMSSAQTDSFAMPAALFDSKPVQPVDLTDAAENSVHAVVHIKSTQLGRTQTVQQMTIGYLSDEDQDNLWTEAHGEEEYRLLLGGGEELVSINLRLQYRISDLPSYLKTSADPELIMQGIAYETITARTINTDLFSLLATDRTAFADSFKA